ncbi:hypothetical protein GQ457_11G021940 [Hibiscus cannabinus]
MCAGFNRYLRLILDSQGPNILALFEPRVCGCKADRFIVRNGFSHSFWVEANGFSGGIWILLKHSARVDVLAVSNQFVHARCLDILADREFLVSFIYASPNRHKRNVLWRSLAALCPDTDMAWVLGGDFNDITASSERYHGPQFTWKRGTLHQRLDRCIGNDNWWHMWPSSHVLHLSRFGSDHPNGEFEMLLTASWKSGNTIVQNLNEFQIQASQWNRDSFGHIGRQKRILLARIRGFEKVNETSVVPHLIELEAKLKDELSETLRKEEVLWFQKAQTNWIKDVDRNTKYYHRITKSKHRQKFRLMLKLDDGQWCSDQSLIRGKVVEFLRCFFLSSTVRSWDIHGKFPPLPDLEVRRIMEAVRDDEVRDDVFSMSPLKSPGLDGVHAMFYQRNWHIVVSSPKVISQFIPISLCSVVYKTLTKVIVNRLKPLLPGLISNTQVSFVPGRCIMDNIIIAQEAIHSMQRKSGRKGWMAIKVDLEKAYDQLEWSFIWETLSDIGLCRAGASIFCFDWMTKGMSRQETTGPALADYLGWNQISAERLAELLAYV